MCCTDCTSRDATPSPFSSINDVVFDIYPNADFSFTNREIWNQKKVINKQTALRLDEYAISNESEYRVPFTSRHCETQIDVGWSFDTHLCSDLRIYLFDQYSFILTSTFPECSGTIIVVSDIYLRNEILRIWTQFCPKWIALWKHQ